MIRKSFIRNIADYDKDTEIFLALPNERTFGLVNELLESIVIKRNKDLRIVRLAQLLKKRMIRLRPWDSFTDSLLVPLWWLEY